MEVCEDSENKVQVLQHRSEKLVRFKTRKGRVLSLVREVYLREEMPCGSPVCVHGCRNPDLAQLPQNATHYVIPDGSVAASYWEVFQLPEITGVIVTLTTLYYVQQQSGRRSYSRMKRNISDPRQSCVCFDNEFHTECFSTQRHDESYESYSNRLNRDAAHWFSKHLFGSGVEIVFVSSSPSLVPGVTVLDLSSYLHRFHPASTAARQLFESLEASLSQPAGEAVEGSQEIELSPEMLLAGVRSGQFLQGVMHVSRYNSAREATVVLSGSSVTKELKETRGEVLVLGAENRRRAVHGDSVALQLLPRAQWRAKSTAIGGGEAETGKEAPPNGRVVGILTRNWRDYVCSIEGTSEDNAALARLQQVLVVPWDRRIPKIRIGTSQKHELSTQRFIVRIDGWEPGSVYPHGHFVRTLGPVGDLETETQTILIEHNLDAKPFTDGQLAELPKHTKENPYQMDPAEVASRRDLRETHLIFSIDPIGCQDVDDTLSVRRLDNGNLQLGVHIADVTQFVRANSRLDLEARYRSTSIYMADRRFDMLPQLLSGDLCSLWSEVDRYAVSVEWELTPALEVVSVEYFRSVIRSRYKLFYEMAQSIYEEKISDADIADQVPELTPLKDKPEALRRKVEEMRTAIKLLVEVASAIKERRMKSGGLELEGIEVSVRFADKERTEMEDLVPKQPLEMHETIAECMIFANHWVARRILKAFPEQACLRHHPHPRQEYFDILVRCAAAKGFEVHTETNKRLAESLNSCEDPDDPNVNKLLRTLATQAMSNAMYFSTGSLPRDEFAHYGLALELYTHFTSPIRRYADVVVHRLLLAALSITPPEDLMSNQELEVQCRHMNERHRQAQYAQRCSTELFQSLFFRSKKEDDSSRLCEGVVYQVRDNGLLVFIPRYGIKGAVPLWKTLEAKGAWLGSTGEVEWLADAVVKRVDEHTITATRDGKEQRYRLFDHVKVRIRVAESHAHGLSLKLDLLGRINVAKTAAPDSREGVPDAERRSMFEAVRAADEAKVKERKRAAMGDISDSDDEDEKTLTKLYNVDSFYHFFARAKVGRFK